MIPFDAGVRPGPKRKPLAVRLWEKVDLSEGPDACWPFSGSKTAKGYGKIAIGGDSNGVPALYAHRVAYALGNGLDESDIPDKMEVRHSCDNPSCCNPQHLLLGTSTDNKTDAAHRGRAFWQRAKRDAEGKFTSEDLEGD